MTPEHTIFLTLAGSQAHGTARDGSDVDLRGVCVLPLDERLALFSTFEQYEGPLDGSIAAPVLERLRAHRSASRGLEIKTECVVFDVAKFLLLSAAANPNALEILFADERDWVFETPAWRRLYAERRVFLTRKVQQTFLGYALAQLRKIENHRSWLLHPPREKPRREDFGLSVSEGSLNPDDEHRIEQSIAEKLRGYGCEDLEMPRAARIAVHERMAAFYRDVLSAPDVEERLRAVATHASGVPTEVVQSLNAERKYRAARKQWDSYVAWKERRNPGRAELERAHGYDTKHAMHLIRLMRMGLEILERGELSVRREDAAELSAIRDGALSFEQLLELAARLRGDMTRAAAVAALPEDVDHARVSELAVSLMRGAG